LSAVLRRHEAPIQRASLEVLLVSLSVRRSRF
jgi:hypothetical protein